MAFNFSNALQGAIRGAAPDVAASVDSGRNIDSIVKSRQFQDLLNQARFVAEQKDAEQKARRAAEDRALLTPEERKQKMLDPAGYRQLRNRSAAGGGSTVDAAEGLGKIQKARNEYDEDAMPDNVARFFDDSTNDIIKPHEKSAVDVVGEAFGMGGSSDDASVSAGDKKARAALIERGMAENDEQAASMVMDAVGNIPGLFSKPDNRGMFTGGVNPFQQESTPVPKTFDELGIGDVQTQQMFGEIESRVPGLRELYASDPQGFQRLFDAVRNNTKKKDGSLFTIQDAVSIIEEAYYEHAK